MAKVLLVDDESNISSVFAAALRAENFEVETRADAESALELASREDFDVLVADMILPGIDGVSLTRSVRKRSPSTRVIVVTGAPSDENCRATMNAGAFSYLSKPIRLQNLIAEVKRATEVSPEDVPSPKKRPKH